MTDTTSAPETPENDTTEQQANQVENTPETPAEEPQEAPVSGNREAAKYRRALRDTETERDTLAARLEALQRQTVENLAAQHVDKPAALWANGTDLADLLDKDGNIDAGKVQAAAESARDTLGLVPPRGSMIIPNQGKTPTKGPKLNTWEAAFSPETR